MAVPPGVFSLVLGFCQNSRQQAQPEQYCYVGICSKMRNYNRTPASIPEIARFEPPRRESRQILGYRPASFPLLIW
jgi:hypothetical protein